ncbi:MAG: family 10 glycosylhydrolase [Planctomycetota bacterium]
MPQHESRITSPNMFVRLWITLLLLGVVVPPAWADQTTQPAEPVRGTWLTTTANDAIETPEKTAATMKRLKELGFNTVYVECWKNGYTEFPSQAAKAVTGVEFKINGPGPQRDLLAEVVREAKANDLRVIAWFEYGFMAAFKETDNELRQKTEWLTHTKDGAFVGEQNPFVWMNPLHPGPQQFLIDIVVEAVENYDLDGVQLDDRIAMPVEMGYDEFTKQLYASEHDGAMPPDDPRDPAWVQWRADKITEYADRFSKAVRAADPDLTISVSPAPYPWSLANYCCDWPAWQDQAWDEFIPQTYRNAYDAFANSWQEQTVLMNDDRRGDLIAGISVNTSRRLVGPQSLLAAALDLDAKRGEDGHDQRVEALREDLDLFLDEHDEMRWHHAAQAMDLAVDYGGGYCIWFSRGVLEVYPEEFGRYHAEMNDE